MLEMYRAVLKPGFSARRFHFNRLTLATTLTLSVAGFLIGAPSPARAQTKSQPGAKTLPARQPFGLSETAAAQMAALLDEKEHRTAAQQKIDSQLLYETRMWNGQEIAKGVQTLETSVDKDMVGRALVDIDAPVTKSLLSAIAAAGGEVLNTVPQYNAIRARVSLNGLEAIAARADVRAIRQAARARKNVGSVTSEGDATHAAATARSTYGVSGIGANIGVLSDGDYYLAASKASGDLPSNVTVLPGQDGPAGNAGEGTAMMQIIYDVAPGAGIYFATADISEAQFAANIQNLAAAGCNIICDDVAYFDEPPFEDGLVARAVNTVTANGVLYFSSAGNEYHLSTGSAVWEGDWNDGGAGTGVLAGRGNVQRFGGATTYNALSYGGGSSPVFLFWSDPFDASTNDYDLFVTNSSGATILSSSTNIQNATAPGRAYERGAASTVNQRVYVVKKAGAAARFLHVNVNDNSLTFATNGQTHGHNSAVEAYNVAAAPASNYSSPVGPYPGVYTTASPVEDFSSDGPRKVFYTNNNTTGVATAITPGNLLSTGGAIRLKPDITAADGVQTTVDTADQNGNYFFRPFFGTSAAAPHAAAIAGLVKSYSTIANGLTINGPSLSTSEMRTVLTSTAIDVAAPGYDNVAGYGIVMPTLAIKFLTNFIDTTSITSKTLTQTGATIQWTTNLPADAVVDYGTTTSYGSVASVSAATQAHAVTLSGLTPGTLYHYRIRTATPTASASYVSGDYTFVTSAAASAPNVNVTGVTLTRSGTVQATITLTNSGGTAATGLTVTSAKAGTSNTTTALPFTVGTGTLNAGGSTSFTLTFPSGTAAGAALLRVGGTYANGSFNASVRVTIP